MGESRNPADIPTSHLLKDALAIERDRDVAADIPSVSAFHRSSFRAKYNEVEGSFQIPPLLTKPAPAYAGGRNDTACL